MLSDIGIVIILLIEVILRFAIGSGGDVKRYFAQSGNKFDFAVVVFSSIALFLYLLETSSFANDADTAMLALRITRDVVRVARIVFFLKELSVNIIDFRRIRAGSFSHDGHDNSHSSPIVGVNRGSKSHRSYSSIDDSPQLTRASSHSRSFSPSPQMPAMPKSIRVQRESRKYDTSVANNGSVSPPSSVPDRHSRRTPVPASSDSDSEQ